MRVFKKVISILLPASALLLVSLPAMARPGVISGNDRGSAVNMRSNASTSAEAIRQSFVGESVDVVAEKPGRDGYTWYKIQANSGTGWVRGDLISMNRGCRMYAMLNGDGPGDQINIRANASRQSGVYQTAVHGDHVRVLGNTESGDGYTWYNKVRHPRGTEGWVRGDLVKFG